MAHRKSTTDFKDLLYQFATESDPFCFMLQWMTENLIRNAGAGFFPPCNLSN